MCIYVKQRRERLDGTTIRNSSGLDRYDLVDPRGTIIALEDLDSFATTFPESIKDSIVFSSRERNASFRVSDAKIISNRWKFSNWFDCWIAAHVVTRKRIEMNLKFLSNESGACNFRSMKGAQHSGETTCLFMDFAVDRNRISILIVVQ